ncbi:MAG: hypothetical protein IJ571_08010 [Ruminococcus sp.]|nr:hypothetical protein [Ruminococcus sp.]
MKDLYISSQADLEKAVEEYGFLPYFRNSIEGFSIEEHIDPRFWFSAEEGAWEWKGPVIRSTGCAYGKFFERKAVYVSREWFPELANYRRNGYDFDALYDDGLAKRADKTLYDLIAENEPVISKQLKKLGNYRKGGNKGFDSSAVRLQEQCYVVISNFVYMQDRFGREYGWGVAEYSTPERFIGDDFTDRVYRHEPEESYELVFDHLRRILPHADERDIKRMLK